MKLRILFLAVLLTACSGAAPATPTSAPEATATELPPTEVPATPTTEPTATPDASATAAAEAAAAEAEALAQIAEDLDEIGYSIDDAELVFLQTEPVAITQNGQNFGGQFEAAGGDVDYGDFMMGVDVAWNTSTAISGCAIVFHGEEDLERGKQLQFYTGRLSGAPYWAVALYEFGAWKATLAYDYTNVLRAEQDDENDYIFIADGSTVIMFANGHRIGATTMPAARLSGRFGFNAWADSGQTTCTFENMWVLEFPEE
jgi:hypothetical protein